MRRYLCSNFFTTYLLPPGSLPPENIAQDPRYIDIEIDVSGFNALDFNLRTEQKEELVKRGASAAKLALAEYKVRIQKQKENLLEKNRAEVVSKIEKVGKLDKELDITESELKSRLSLDVSSQIKEALDWLSNRDILAKKAGKDALEKFPELKQNEDMVKRFYWEIEKYLELIYNSLLTRRTNLLRVPPIRQNLSNLSVYVEALNAVKNRIPEDLNTVARQEIEHRIDYLKKMIT